MPAGQNHSNFALNTRLSSPRYDTWCKIQVLKKGYHCRKIHWIPTAPRFLSAGVLADPGFELGSRDDFQDLKPLVGLPPNHEAMVYRESDAVNIGQSLDGRGLSPDGFIMGGEGCGGA